MQKKNDKIKYFAGKLTDGKIRIVLWEKKNGSLQEDWCYKVENVHVKNSMGINTSQFPTNVPLKILIKSMM